MSIFDFKTKASKDKNVDKKSASVKSAVKKETKKSATKDLYVGTEKVGNVKNSDKKSASLNYKYAYKVLIKPLVTEKASVLGVQNKYVFEVAKNTNKIEVAKAINYVYGVTPKSINIIRVGGKQVRTGRTVGKRKDWKKAVVTLQKGESIKVYEGV